MDEKRTMLRHTVATVAYRGGKAVRGVPASFATFEIGTPPRTPLRILSHISDLFDWAMTIADGAQKWVDSVPTDWDREVERFHAALARFDARLADDAPLSETPERLFQGPVADALTHVGQLAMLRRLAGANMKSENYHRAEIVTGHVGPDQSTPKREFD